MINLLVGANTPQTSTAVNNAKASTRVKGNEETNESPSEKAKEALKGEEKASNPNLAAKFVSAHGDTVEISKAGSNALTASNNVSNNSASSKTISATSLFKYTTSQLKQLYAGGKITSTAYQLEMNRRGVSK